MNQRPLATLLTEAQATLLHPVLTSSTCQEPYTVCMGDCTKHRCLPGNEFAAFLILQDMDGYGLQRKVQAFFKMDNKLEMINQTFEEEHHSVKVLIRYGRINIIII